MAYEVLARKWRPRIFQDVLGQGHITQTLINAIKTDRLAHAYLFSGARGVGKTSVARILAKAINCSGGDAGNPCNECPSCADITEGVSVDVQEIDGASNRGIDEIRELRENIRYMPSSGKFRVYIIDEVHMLTLPAFNALLKTLEEPPPHVKFIFATTEPHKVPVTILSRCQRFDFKRIPMALIMEQLERITDKEGIEISRTGLAIIAREAEGSMRDAESLLDQVASYTGSKIEDKNIIEILGVIDGKLIFETSGAIIDGLPDRCIEIIERIYNYGYDIKQFYLALMDQFRNLMICLAAPQYELLDIADDDMDELKSQAERAGLERLQQSLNILIAREEALRFTAHPRLVLENIMIKLCQLGDVISFGDIIKKIERLEKGMTGSPISYGDVYEGNISEPETAWEKDDKTDIEGHEAVIEGSGWDNFLKYLSSKNRGMYNVLREWKLKGFSGDSIEIARGESPFSSVYLDDTENLNKFLGYCREFFKREIRIRMIGNKVKADIHKDNIPSDLPSPVRDVIQVFEGQIKGENPVSKKKNMELNN
ncbi:MAG TPA: DNA polymerase III subunit gamma/tau [Desulfatiglandales bacterium]|nr:DNA polymerase III subunit gamma/tau [Desulfatiglandales bacterium]